jgi:hypothetical protein
MPRAHAVPPQHLASTFAVAQKPISRCRRPRSRRWDCVAEWPTKLAHRSRERRLVPVRGIRTPVPWLRKRITPCTALPSAWFPAVYRAVYIVHTVRFRCHHAQSVSSCLASPSDRPSWSARRRQRPLEPRAHNGAAQIRLVAAAQVCVEYRRENRTCDSLEHCAEYLDRMLKTNDLLAPAMRETLGAVRATAATSEDR